MKTGRAPEAPAASHAWPQLFVLHALELAPDVADTGDTGRAITEAQFAALRLLALARTRRTSGASGVTTTSGMSAIGPCANR